MSINNITARLDEVVDDFASRCRFFNQDINVGRARMMVFQHRQNTRHRNSVLKLRVATNCPVWEIRMRIIGACSEELIADHEHGGGKAHWQILEELGVSIGLTLDEIRSAPLQDSTRMCWMMWDSPMSNTHWLQGLIGNTCAERVNVPGYGRGVFREKGWFGKERLRWRSLFNLPDDKLVFFKMHSVADIEHSNLGWRTVAEYADRFAMADTIVEACRQNLLVWEHYLDGIADAGDELDEMLTRKAA